MKKLTAEQFIEKAKIIHSDKYDYSLVEYVNNKVKVKLICNQCKKVIDITPAKHLSGQGCKKCNSAKSLEERNLKEQFIEKAKLIHNNKYDYSLVEYTNAKTKVKIICKKHGIFEQKPTNHLSGQGCRNCKRELLKALRTKTTEQFIEEAKSLYGDKYDYSLAKYVDKRTKLKVFCNDCKTYAYQTPFDHLNYCGCLCRQTSKGEREIEKILKEKEIDFEVQKKYNDLRDKGLLSYDFYIPSKNLLIEYNGMQHYKEVKRWGGRKRFLIQKHHDWLKRRYAKINKINLLTIPYWEWYNIREILETL